MLHNQRFLLISPFVFIVIAIGLNSCNSDKLLLLRNGFSKDDQLKVNVKINNEKIISKYISVGKTSSSFEKISLEDYSNDSFTIEVYLPDWGIKQVKRKVGNFKIIYIIITNTLNKQLWGGPIYNYKNYTDSITIPEININVE